MSISFDDYEVIGGYRVHPAASVFPLLEGDDFENLVQSILLIGVQHPIVVMRHPDGDILIDGRNRLRAIEKARATRSHIHVPIQEWIDDGRSICEYIHEVNMNRRHLTADAMALAGAQIWELIKKEREAIQKASQFKKGQSGNPTGKKQVDTKTCPPAPRNTKKKHANSTAGQVASLAKTSIHKARQAIAVHKEVADGKLPKEVADEVMAGKKKLRDVIPKTVRTIRKKTHRSMSVILESIRDLIAEWKDAEHNAAVLKNELSIQVERL